jgi:hypothetical protein
MQRLLDETPQAPTTTKPQRAVIVTVAAVATGSILLVALALGNWAYHFRLLTSHEGRVARLVAQKPTVELVTLALQNENSPLVAAPASPAELARAVSDWGGGRGGQIEAKAAGAAQTRVFRAGEVTYFLFFDRSGVLYDFVCALN